MEMTNARGKDFEREIRKDLSKIEATCKEAVSKMKDANSDIGIALKSIEIKLKEGD